MTCQKNSLRHRALGLLPLHSPHPENCSSTPRHEEDGPAYNLHPLCSSWVNEDVQPTSLLWYRMLLKVPKAPI